VYFGPVALYYLTIKLVNVMGFDLAISRFVPKYQEQYRHSQRYLLISFIWKIALLRYQRLLLMYNQIIT